MSKLISLLLALLCTMAGAAPVAPLAAPSDSHSSVLTQVPGVYRLMVGDVRVTALSDGTVPIDLHKLLLGTSATQTDKLLKQSFLQNPVEASINAYLLDIGTKHVLVDTGSGELFGPGNGGKLVDSLAAAGTTPAQITDILITHVHTDHSGGLVKGGQIVFPNATIHAGEPDVTFFLDPANAAKTGYDKRYFDEATITLKPYVDAGKVKPFSTSAQILPGLTAELHPGHTPGSAFYVLESRGERMVFVGDIVHAGAVQFPSPGITIVFDQDPAKAAQVRAKAFAGFASTGTMIAAPHLPFPGIGHVQRAQQGYRWLPVEYGNRDAP